MLNLFSKFARLNNFNLVNSNICYLRYPFVFLEILGSGVQPNERQSYGDFFNLIPETPYLYINTTHSCATYKQKKTHLYAFLNDTNG